ncbi:MBL fold metallo-hydrolase, partial [Candidatus Bathyarchaeota archaeon]|nr:MBL fold metallo-hydrolase [Candidatus Bathyarchaeota archaeon]
MANVDVLIHEFGSFYGFKKGFPVLIRGHSLLMASEEFDRLLENSFDSWMIFGSCNTALIESSKRIIVDPGAREVGSWGVLESRLKELGLTLSDIDVVVNTHLHGDHAGSNFIFRGKKLIVHKKEVLSAQSKWPEFTEACVKPLEVEEISNDTHITEDVKVITTPGHTPGSISIIADTPEGLVAIVGDAVMSKKDYLQRKVPEWVENKEAYSRSIDKLRKFNPKIII